MHEIGRVYGRPHPTIRKLLLPSGGISPSLGVAAAHGWTVLAEHIYSDAAVSGTTSDRAGLTKLLAAAESKPRPFDAVLVDDSSRLSRKLSDALLFSERLKFAGVRVVFVSQGFDSDSEQSDILMAVHGITDSQYIKELSKKTFRGLEGKVLAQLHHGGRCFGYRSVQSRIHCAATNTAAR